VLVTPLSRATIAIGIPQNEQAVEKVPLSEKVRHARENGHPVTLRKNWIPACTGMTKKDVRSSFSTACEGLTRKDAHKNPMLAY
jgi:hypothetical protein